MLVDVRRHRRYRYLVIFFVIKKHRKRRWNLRSMCPTAGFTISGLQVAALHFRCRSTSAGVRVSASRYFNRIFMNTYAVTHICYTNSDVSALTDAIFFSIRIVSMWNSLPAETMDFSGLGLDKFNNSVSNMFLLKFCQVNFEWISPCDTETYCTFLCHYVHNSIVLWLLSSNCFIILLQHVRGQSALCCQINV